MAESLQLLNARLIISEMVLNLSPVGLRLSGSIHLTGGAIFRVHYSCK